MAGTFYGGDVGQLRQLAKELAGGANKLDALSQQLGSTISAGLWKGRDGDRFRGVSYAEPAGATDPDAVPGA